MIENWESEDGLKAIEVMGTPKWEIIGKAVGLYRSPHHGGWFVSTQAEGTTAFSRSNHEALCILRNAAVEWLVAKYEDGTFGGFMAGEWFINVAVPHNAGYDEIGCGYDYDAALIAAVLAGEKE